MNIEQTMLDPSSVFDSPGDVCSDQKLTRDQKIGILRQWEYDARELQVAEEENMGGGPGDLLDEIINALKRLDAIRECDRTPPTKHGGT